MSSLSTHKSSANENFVCACKEWMRSACEREPFYKQYENQRYCVLHFPGKEKIIAFNEAFKRKREIKNFNFRGVWFPDELSFKNSRFEEKADFSSAIFCEYVDFSDTIFEEEAKFLSSIFMARANFASVRFRAWADFRNCDFRERADFLHTTFSERANFNGVIFNGEADFGSAIFNAEVNFSGTIFRKQTFFGRATFEDYLRFSSKNDLGFAGSEHEQMFGETSSLDFQFIRTEKPDCISFHTLTLLPHWFVNVDMRKFDFTNVEWHGSLNQEIENLKINKVSPPHRLLAIACRQLAVNAEENHRYEEASKFRYWSMDARRRERWRGFTLWRLSWWYWAASGYGERVLRAFLVLLGIWLIFALLYTQVGFTRWEPKLTTESDVAMAKRDETGAPLSPLSRSLAYSASVMTLQKPEPRPATFAAQTLFIIETILGPLQAALLALAIRRKFMR